MVEVRTSYKKTFKSTLVFGGAQLIQMVVNILRAKFIAIILGTTGMGVNAIFQSVIIAINNFTSFGIFQSAVREISQNYDPENLEKASKKVAVFRKMVWITGLLGTVICILISPLLSKLSFGNNDYTVSFIVASFSLLFIALANSQTTILQSTQNVKYLAKASVYGALMSFLICIPVYYIFGIKGIPISLVLSYFVFFIVRYFFTKKVDLGKKVDVSFKEVFKQGIPMITLGTVLMIGTVLITFFTYLTNIFISRYGTIEDVGLFQGATSISNQSIIIIFAILSSDFFPRISAICKNNSAEEFNKAISQQIEIVSLIIIPISLFLLAFTPLVVNILLSKEFVGVIPILRWMSIALVFKGISVVMSYVILAKGDRKAYLIFEAILGNGLVFILNILSYYFWGLDSIGLSYAIGIVVLCVILSLIVIFKYKYIFTRALLLLIVKYVFFSLILYFNVVYNAGILQYVISIIVMIFSLYILYNVLNKRVDIRTFVKDKFFKR